MKRESMREGGKCMPWISHSLDWIATRLVFLLFSSLLFSSYFFMFCFCPTASSSLSLLLLLLGFALHFLEIHSLCLLRYQLLESLVSHFIPGLLFFVSQVHSLSWKTTWRRNSCVIQFKEGRKRWWCMTSIIVSGFIRGEDTRISLKHVMQSKSTGIEPEKWLLSQEWCMKLKKRGRREILVIIVQNFHPTSAATLSLCSQEMMLSILSKEEKREEMIPL